MAIRGGLSYPGGKWKALPQILPLIPDGIEDWREPFFGGGSVTLGYMQSLKSKGCKRYVVGDIASEIWAYWEGVKRYPKEAAYIAEEWFKRDVPTHSTLVSMDTTDESYNSIYEQVEKEGKAFFNVLKTIDCSTLDLAQRCARTFLINKISFSALGDSGTLSMNRLVRFKIESVNAIMEDVSPLLQSIEIKNCSFEETIADTDKEKSFVFFDPPYWTQEKSGLYGKDGDTHHGFPHEKFIQTTKELECRWLVTYDDSILVRKNYAGFYMRPFKIAYTMALNKKEDALAGEELFISNYDISDKSSYDDLADIL